MNVLLSIIRTLKSVYLRLFYGNVVESDLITNIHRYDDDEKKITDQITSNLISTLKIMFEINDLIQHKNAELKKEIKEMKLMIEQLKKSSNLHDTSFHDDYIVSDCHGSTEPLIQRDSFYDEQFKQLLDNVKTTQPERYQKMLREISMTESEIDKLFEVNHDKNDFELISIQSKQNFWSKKN